MPETAARRFCPSRPTSARRARRDCEVLLSGWGFERASGFVDDLLLIVGELVGNAVTRGRVPGARGRQVGFLVEMRGGVVRVEVRDGRDESMPVERRAGAVGRGGRGLALVPALADKWGVLPEVVGKTVWAEKRIPVRV